MLLVSVGTGSSPAAKAYSRISDSNLLNNAVSIPSALMYAAQNEQDLLCRVFGECLAGCVLDREIGALIGNRAPEQPKLFRYMRYNAELDDEGLRQIGIANIVPEHVQPLDAVDHMPELQAVGRAAADRQVRAEHFAGF